MNNQMMNNGQLMIKGSLHTQLNKLNQYELQNRLDEAEKNQNQPFTDFSDIEMMFWFLYKQKHLNVDHDKSKRTRQEYERELILFVQQILEFGSDIGLDMMDIIEGSLFKSLAPRHIRRYQQWLATKSPYVQKKGSYAPATLTRKTTILKNFLAYLFEANYIKEPIQNGLLTATVRKDDRPNRDLGPKEVIHLLDHFRDQQHPIPFGMIHILTMTGMRNEEFCLLKTSDVKYDSITGGYYLDVLGKGNKRRQIPLKEIGIKTIRMFRHARGLPDFAEAELDSPLFTTNTGRAYSPSYLSQYLTKSIRETKLPFLKHRVNAIGPHTFRHAFAIISHLNGVDIYKIMRSLGHEKIETTMIYLEKVFDKERHAILSWKKEVFGEYI